MSADPTKFDLWTLDGARGFAAAVRDEVREHIEKGGEIELTVFLVSARKGEPQPIVVQCPISDLKKELPRENWTVQRDAFLFAVRYTASEEKALAAITVAEAYTAKAPDGKRELLPDNLADCEDAIDVAWLSLEHRELEVNENWSAAVRKQGDKRLVEPWERMQANVVSGRLAKFLP